MNTDQSKRDFLRLAGTGAAGLALGGVIAPVSAPNTPEPSCSKKSIEIEVSTAISFLNKVSSLLPAKAQIIAKVVGALNDFNAAYQAGKFDSAGAFLANASVLFEQLLGDIGVNLNPTVKIALAIVDAAISAIAVLMKSQSNAPGVAAVISAATPEQQKQMAIIEKRAAHAEQLFAAIQR